MKQFCGQETEQMMGKYYATLLEKDRRHYAATSIAIETSTLSACISWLVLHQKRLSHYFLHVLFLLPQI
jgi:hypothetical protein